MAQTFYEHMAQFLRDRNAKVHDRILPALEEFARTNGFKTIQEN